MPETTENYHRIPVRDCKITSTMSLGDGIKALYCGGEKQIATYLFPVGRYSMADAKQWVSEHKDVQKDISIPICKLDEDRHLVYGVVLEPDTEDLQEDVISEEEIEKAAHRFLKDYRTIEYEHTIDDPDSAVVENYIAPVDFELGGQPVKKGSWVMVTHCGNEEIWKQLKSGELTGFSIYGHALRS